MRLLSTIGGVDFTGRERAASAARTGPWLADPVRLPFNERAGAEQTDAAGIAAEKDAPLWRSMPRAGGMGARRMSRVDVFRMIKRRVKTVGLGEANCHTFRATGITAYLLNGGTLERAQAIAAHESPRTTKLYDRTADEVTIEDIEKIGI